ncbi:hypothetical protein FSPOR_6682 [Fusarium sporotrichioides]|uniref:F-box domain-containing protein n=1 Tax=Fusarium sporotrichioides TaxID=5514 RepID=A0A395S1U6_FUSSP|nr:hypothetical protein FSPOR_6682 [Fusarium sporotrichioides]
MRRFKPEPQFSTPWTQRLVDQLCFRRDTYRIPVLEADEEKQKVSYLDTLVPEDAVLPVPLKPQKLGCRRNLESRLLQLPPELLIYTMLFLPYSSLYMVRQTCQVLRSLTDDFQFEYLHWEILQHERPASYTTLPVCDQPRNIKRIFLRRSLCTQCVKLFDSGELEEKLKKLWQPVRCTRCETEHAELLFSQGDRGHNVCMGLQGNLPLANISKSWARMDSSELQAFKEYRPRVETSCGSLQYSRSFALVKIAEEQYPGMPSLKSQLLKRLKETRYDGLYQHVSTQLDAIVSSLPSDKCGCFPASGLPVHQPMPTTRPRCWCDNHGYDCRYCGARYFWFYDNNYIVLRVWMDVALKDVYNMGWIGNITFYTDENPIHPILNENTKGIIWCHDPLCGTGWGNRWLLMVEIMKRARLQDLGPIYDRVTKRDRSFAANLPFTLEYQVFQNAAGWMAPPNMLRNDLSFPVVIEFDYMRTGLRRD